MSLKIQIDLDRQSQGSGDSGLTGFKLTTVNVFLFVFFVAVLGGVGWCVQIDSHNRHVAPISPWDLGPRAQSHLSPKTLVSLC